MIHVRVSQQHDINRRKVLDKNTRTTLASQHHQAVCKDWIDQQALPPGLYQERGMPDKCDGRFVGRCKNRNLRLTAQRFSMALAYQPPKLFQLRNPKRSGSSHRIYWMLMSPKRSKSVHGEMDGRQTACGRFPNWKETVFVESSI